MVYHIVGIFANCYEILFSPLLTVLGPRGFHAQLGGVTVLFHSHKMMI